MQMIINYDYVAKRESQGKHYLRLILKKADARQILW